MKTYWYGNFAKFHPVNLGDAKQYSRVQIMWNGDFCCLLEAPSLSWLSQRGRSTQEGKTSGNVTHREGCTATSLWGLDFPSS